MAYYPTPEINVSVKCEYCKSSQRLHAGTLHPVSDNCPNCGAPLPRRATNETLDHLMLAMMPPGFMVTQDCTPSVSPEETVWRMLKNGGSSSNQMRPSGPLVDTDKGWFFW